MRRRVLAAAMAVCLGLFGCSPSGSGSGQETATRTTPPNGLPTADSAAATIIEALNAHDLSEVKATQAADEVQAEYETILAGMDAKYPTATLGQITYEGQDEARAALKIAWPLGVHGWEYDTTLKLRYSDSQWQLDWAPDAIHPLLTSQTRLRHVQKENTRAAIKDLNDLALVEERALYQVGLDKSNLTQDQWASAAAQLATVLGIDSAAYQEKVAAAGSKAFVIATTLEQGQIPAATSTVPGLYVRETSAVLGPSQTFAAPILGTVGEPTAEMIEKSGGTLGTLDRIGLSGLQARYDEQLRGVPLVRVDLIARAAATEEASATPFEEQVLFQQDASTGSSISISLDRTLQARAEEVLSAQSGLATLVVLDINSGGIVAAAQSPSGGVFPHTTASAFAPGSTFKAVTSLAMMRQAGITPATTVECPASLSVGGHTFTNYTSYPAAGSGSVPLSTAFKWSCNTTFAGASSTVNAEQLHSAAASLGVGTDYDAGYRVNFGTVEPKDSIDLAASMIGQGQVTMSPLAMAAVAASVGSGKTVIPWLVQGHEATSTAEPLSTTETSQLQELMGAVVASGTAQNMQGLMAGAKTGTAEFGPAGEQQTHAWMIAYNDTYAVSAFIEVGDGGGRSAGPLILELFS